MVATAATNGPITCSQDAAKASLADCDAVRTLLGATDQAEALARIHVNYIPEPANSEHYTRAELDAIRPYVQVGDAREGGGMDNIAQGMAGLSGELDIWLEREIATDETDAAAVAAMQTTIGRVMEEMLINSESGDGGYIIVSRMEWDGPYLPMRDDEARLGRFIAGAIRVTWNSGGELS